MKNCFVSKMGNLTLREKEVLELITKGHSNSEISDILKISPHTTKAHIASILDKLDAKTRLLAVIKAIKYSIV